MQNPLLYPGSLLHSHPLVVLHCTDLSRIPGVFWVHDIRVVPALWRPNPTNSASDELRLGLTALQMILIAVRSLKIESINNPTLHEHWVWYNFLYC